ASESPVIPSAGARPGHRSRVMSQPGRRAAECAPSCHGTVAGRKSPPPDHGCRDAITASVESMSCAATSRGNGSPDPVFIGMFTDDTAPDRSSDTSAVVDLASVISSIHAPCVGHERRTANTPGCDVSSKRNATDCRCPFTMPSAVPERSRVVGTPSRVAACTSNRASRLARSYGFTGYSTDSQGGHLNADVANDAARDDTGVRANAAARDTSANATPCSRRVIRPPVESSAGRRIVSCAPDALYRLDDRCPRNAYAAFRRLASSTLINPRVPAPGDAGPLLLQRRRRTPQPQGATVRRAPHVRAGTTWRQKTDDR